MLSNCFLRVMIWMATASAVFSSPTGTDITFHPGSLSPRDVIRAVGRSLSEYSHQKRDVILQNSTAIEKSWNDAVLISYEHTYTKETNNGTGEVEITGSIEVTCTTCYLRGTVNAQLLVDGAFNLSETFKDFTNQVGDAVENTTDKVVDYVQDSTRTVITNLKDGFDLDDFDLPPLDVNFNVEIPEIPECQLRFQFDELELYVALETVFSGGVTYTLNLYTSQTPIGIRVSEDLFIGVIVSVDLILSAEAEITISSGFHIKIDDGAELQIGLFGDNVADTRFNGGLFEFLPVTIESAGVVLKAVLRIKVRAGFEISTPEVELFGFSVSDAFNLKASAGVEVSVWTHIGELTTNVTVTPEGDDTGCQLQVQEEYQFVIGAAAGATVAIADHTWGPTPNTTIPIFSTALTQCAFSTTPPAAIRPRQFNDDAGLTTTTISTEVTYRGVQCISSELVNCPASLQKTTKTVTEITLVTAVPSGVEATFPATTQSTAVQTIAFGTAANKLFEVDGAPTPYSPDSPLHRSGGGVNLGLVVGLSIGLGIPIIVGLIAGCAFWRRRKIIKTLEQQPVRPQLVHYQTDSYNSANYVPNKHLYTTNVQPQY